MQVSRTNSSPNTGARSVYGCDPDHALDAHHRFDAGRRIVDPVRRVSETLRMLTVALGEKS
jgi:hypothetical protein